MKNDTSIAEKQISVKENKESPPDKLLTISSPEQKVDHDTKKLVQEIVKSESKDELEGLYSQFNINNTKKNVIRISKVNKLLDMVNDEAEKRLSQSSATMSNKEIIDYMNAFQTQLDNASNVVNGIKDINPPVQISNTQHNIVNINMKNDMTSLDRDSRERITSLIGDIINAKGKEQKDEINKDDDKTIIDATVIDEDKKEVK